MQRKMVRKTYTLNEKSISFLESVAEEENISQSDALRRIIGFYAEHKNKEKKDEEAKKGNKSA